VVALELGGAPLEALSPAAAAALTLAQAQSLRLELTDGWYSLGGLPAAPELAVPERHLGLVSATIAGSSDWVERLAAWVAEHVDLDGVRAIAGGPARGDLSGVGGGAAPAAPPRGVALPRAPQPGRPEAGPSDRG
jgi:cobyrinic acid a,c-diamide synthase